MAFTPVWMAPAAETFEALQRRAEESIRAREEGRSRKPSKQEGLFKQVFKCVQLLLENPRHPGLKTHEFHSLPHPYDARAKVFEAYVQNRTPGAYRLFWCYGPKKGQITLLAIEPHP